MKFIKENIKSIAAILVFAIVGVTLSTLMYQRTIDAAIANRKDLIRNQVQLSGQGLERSIRDFEEDFYYFILGTDSLMPGEDGNIPTELKRKIRLFLAHHEDLVDSMEVLTPDTGLVARLNNQTGVEIRLEDTPMPTFLNSTGNVDFQFIPEFSSLIYKHDRLIYLLHVNTGRFAKERIGDYYLGEGGFKFVYGLHEGITPFEVSKAFEGTDVSLLFDEAELTAIQDNTTEATSGSSVINVEINGNKHELLLEQYPFEVFDTHFSLLFASDVGFERSSMAQTFYVILGSGIALILLVIFVFVLNLNKLRKTSASLEQSKEELTKMVRQQKLLFEYSEDFTYRHDLNEEYDYVSENVERILGYTPDEYARPTNRRYTDNPINEQGMHAKQLTREQGKEQGVFYLEMLDARNEPIMLEFKEKPILNEKNEPVGVIGLAKDVTAKFASDQKFRVLFEYSSDPYFIYNGEGVLDCNEAAVKTLGLKTKEEVIGRSLGEFSPEKQADGRVSSYKAEEMDNIAYEHGSHRFEWLHTKVGGDVFPVEVTLTPVMLNNKRVILTVWHDLTERKRIEQVLIESRKKAEELASQKQQFLSSMSHEIRTPLNAVIGTTHFLLEDDPKPSQIEKLKTLKFSADNLLSLVNDILDHSKIEAGKVIFNRERFDLYDRLTGVHQVMKIKAESKNIDLQLHIDDQIPHNVIGDPVRLNQILLNLVSNAVKFTEEGKVEVKANLLGKTDTHAEVQFDVTDTGIGIPAEKLTSIFETFTQANARILNSFGGTGLGLAITKKLVELQGGSITVNSTHGEGSTFSFKMSFKYDDLADNANPLNQEVDHSIQGARILLVEDNPINQKIAGQFLNNWGAQVDFADNGKIALDKVASKAYDFILMDIQMPEMDGYEATRAIRAIDDDYFKNIPIITLTADAFSEVRDRVLEAGMNDYVTKPINPKQFLKTISGYYQVKV